MWRSFTVRGQYLFIEKSIVKISSEKAKLFYIKKHFENSKTYSFAYRVNKMGKKGNFI